MNLKLVAAFAVLSATPALAQAPQGNIPPPPKPTLGDIHNVVQIISGDKAKAKIYCDIANLDYQIAAAQAAKNQNKFAELEHVSIEVNRRDSQVLLDGRVSRH